MTTAQQAVAKAMTEKELSQAVVGAAQTLGWRVYRTWNSIHSPAGWPDLSMVRNGRLLCVELKREGKQPTLIQQVWLDSLAEVPGVSTYVWRPSDWLSGDIDKVLMEP